MYWDSRLCLQLWDLLRVCYLGIKSPSQRGHKKPILLQGTQCSHLEHRREELELRNQSCSCRLSGQFCLQQTLIRKQIPSSQIDMSPRTEAIKSWVWWVWLLICLRCGTTFALHRHYRFFPTTDNEHRYFWDENHHLVLSIHHTVTGMICVMISAAWFLPYHSTFCVDWTSESSHQSFFPRKLLSWSLSSQKNMNFFYLQCLYQAHWAGNRIACSHSGSQMGSSTAD